MPILICGRSDWAPSARCACGAFVTISLRFTCKIYSLSNQHIASQCVFQTVTPHTQIKSATLGDFNLWSE